MRSVDVALVVFTVRGHRLEALLVRQPGNVWTLPATRAARGEGLEEAAHAALADQTGVRGIAIEQLYTFDHPPDGVTVAYLALIAAGRHPLAPGPDAVEVRWFPVVDLPPLGPDHAEIVAYGLARLRAKTAYAPIAFQLLPDTFTLSELQAVYEAVLDARLDTRNFRRDVLAAGVVEPVGRVRAEGPGRPAKLYRSVGGEFAVVARERRAARAIAEGVHPEASPPGRHHPA
jgi:8-oxo-dGTP diphosphatase